MPSTTIPGIGIQYGWDFGEDNWNVGMDQNLKILGVIARGTVLDRDLTAPPGSPAEGDAYIPAATATGAWVGHEDEIAVWLSGAWFYITPVVGQVFWIEDEDFAIRREGASWVKYLGNAATRSVGESPTNLMEVGAFGVGMSKDMTVDLDTISYPQFSYFRAGSTNKPPFFSGGGNMISQSFPGSIAYSFQFASDNGANKIGFRGSDNAGVWGPWKEIAVTGVGQDVSFNSLALSSALTQVAAAPTINDDDVYSFALPSNKPCFLLVAVNEDTSLLAVRSTSSAGTTSTSVLTQKGAAIVAETNQVLTGTSGADTKLNIACDPSAPQNVYIENRLGGARVVTLMSIG